MINHVKDKEIIGDSDEKILVDQILENLKCQMVEEFVHHLSIEGNC